MTNKNTRVELQFTNKTKVDKQKGSYILSNYLTGTYMAV